MPHTRKFEKDFAKKIGKYALMVNSDLPQTCWQLFVAEILRKILKGVRY